MMMFARLDLHAEKSIDDSSLAEIGRWESRARDLRRHCLSVRRVALRGRGTAAASIEYISQCRNSMAGWGAFLGQVMTFLFGRSDGMSLG